MSKLWQLLNKDLSVLSTVSIILAIIVVICMLNPQGSLAFFVMLIALALASLIVLLYLLLAWRKLTRSDRWGIGLSVIVWLALAYGVVHANGFTIASLFWWR